MNVQPRRTAVAAPPVHVGAEARETRRNAAWLAGLRLVGVGIVLGLPALVWAASVYCSAAGWPALPAALPGWAELAATFSWEALALYTAWFALQLALHLVVPGAVVDGVRLRDGRTLRYKLNGWRCFLATHAVVGALHASGALRLTWVFDHVAQLATAAIVFSCALSAWLYAASFGGGGQRLLAEGGNSGYPLYDFFIGRELNPRLHVGVAGTIDLKFFCELRPGLFLWHLINVACVVT